MRRIRSNILFAAASILAVNLVIIACARTMPAGDSGYFSVSGTRQAAALDGPRQIQVEMDSENGQSLYPTPTPDEPHLLPSARQDALEYSVQSGDTLGTIAEEHGVSIELIAQANELANPDVLEVGQLLVIPVATPEGTGPDFKIIPDSELVYGPGTIGFNTAEFVSSQNGFLSTYSEEIDGETFNGAEIIHLVAENFSVNPRLLLAVLEYQSGWVTQAQPPVRDVDFPIGVRNPTRKGLYREIAWVANSLNHGYYVWRVNGSPTWVLGDGSSIPIAATINAGTAGVQYMFSQLYNLDGWKQAVGQDGLHATFTHLFAYPFSLSFEPLIPADLQQPHMQLPFELGTTWSFTGGPHGGWDSGSAWAALDFAPPSDALGCVPSDEWVVAVSDGTVTRTGDGQVIQDLDGDGYEQTGWVVLYMHIERKDRVQPGTVLKAGERVGHPSCEGGISSGTHVHLARKYNGEWIAADQDMPFVLDGWVSVGDGNIYDGFLRRDDQTVEAYAGRSDTNKIRR